MAIKVGPGPVTEAQKKFLDKLVVGSVIPVEDLVSFNLESLNPEFTKVRASYWIDRFLQCPKATPVASAVSCPSAPVEEGVYLFEDDSIVKVKKSKNTSKPYTLRWEDFSGTRLTLTGEKVSAHWAYRPELLSQVTTAQKMTLGQAKTFVLIYKQCARCGRTLKAAESVEAGIGPVCAKFFGAWA
jgi:Family of unknown function (DUF6011)